MQLERMGARQRPTANSSSVRQGFSGHRIYKPLFQEFTHMRILSRTGKAIWLCTFLLVFSLFALAQTTVIHPEGHDTSKPLREMRAIPPQWENMNEHPVQPVPHGSQGGHDTALQSTGLASTSATVSSA